MRVLSVSFLLRHKSPHGVPKIFPKGVLGGRAAARFGALAFDTPRAFQLRETCNATERRLWIRIPSRMDERGQTKGPTKGDTISW